MLGFKELKDRLKTDDALKNKFLGVENENQAIIIAKHLGYEVSTDDIKNDAELSENLLEAVAGGKGDIEKNTFFHVEAEGYDLVIDTKTGNIISSHKK